MECNRKKNIAKNPLLAALSRPRRTMVRRSGPSRVPAVSAGLSLYQPADRDYGVPSRLDWNQNPPKPRVNSYPPFYWDSAPPLASVGMQTSFESEIEKSQPAPVKASSHSKTASKTTKSSLSEKHLKAKHALFDPRRSQTAFRQEDQQKSLALPLNTAHSNSWLGSSKEKKSYQLEPWRFQTADKHDFKKSPLIQLSSQHMSGDEEWNMTDLKDDLESARDLIRIALDPVRSGRSRNLRRRSASKVWKTVDIQTDSPAKKLPDFSFYAACGNTWPGSLNGQKSYQMEPWRYYNGNKHDEKETALAQDKK